MLRAIFMLNLVLLGAFYVPGWLVLRVLTLGRYPPRRGEPHSDALVALTGIAFTITVLVVLLR
ncbi:MAG: hypothetical protein KKD25_07200 [Gammaproteobacteria bacterium]|jgi:hypothetical protein|nr:hypothetical protein [Gammaproteobacteria bacterium]MBU0772613.1 hypothetical protein [Gammaproteobacteria bacterium]MBU0857187.1 hypothetical protein [Gammaproteobacteria bacterium]MBU1846460.1 hypothetical protein [Gammaproteobacteria bacterium]